ncbi:MAG: MotA/TolQ/ExbB proton channel family protein [Halioglobus sp.]|tara:strand:+ start:516 stop:1901 length:1386 start_codon:yes stop_codon:yes gene_type:complete
MSITWVKGAALALCGALAVSGGSVLAQQAKSLDELLGFVKQGQTTEARENRQREQRFANDKAGQAAELKRAQDERARQEALSTELENAFEENELLIAAKEELLTEKLGTLKELFGHLTSAAGDLITNFENYSLASAQYPGREVFLQELVERMNNSTGLPSIEEIERVWYELLREIRETGAVTTFSADVSSPGGESTERQVLRVGSFNIVDMDGNYLSFQNGKLSELARQPSGPYTGWAADLASASGGLNPFGVDPTGPTGGSYLAAIIGTPTLAERWHQGGYVGYAITALGIFAFLLAIYRFSVLTTVGGRVSAQLRSDKANTNNPLGRVLKIHEDNPNMDTETLELKLSEGVLKETPELESGLTLLKIIAAIAPLMGLLGTVTGMILTFQAITIFGAGDPKAMAGGISSALITTVLGLLVAIPTVLMFTIVNGRAQRIIHILDEQTTGMIAEHTEANLRS